MSYLVYNSSEEGNAQYNLYSELPFEKIQRLVRYLHEHEDLKDVDYRRYVIDAVEITFLRFVLLGPFQPGAEVFRNVFPKQFLDKYVPESRVAGETFICSGALPPSFAKRINRLRLLCSSDLANLTKCRNYFETNGRRYSSEDFLRLAQKYNLSGGCWLIYTRNYKLQGINAAVKPRKVMISNDQCKALSFKSFLGILELVQNGAIPEEYFKAARWIKCEDEKSGTSYVTKILNTRSNYLANVLNYGATKSDLWYFNEDTQVCDLYRLLNKKCVDRDHQHCKYKAEVVSACNLNRRNLTDDIVLCFYPSLRRATMMITDEKVLEDAYANNNENVVRFGHLKTNLPKKNFDSTNLSRAKA